MTDPIDLRADAKGVFACDCCPDGVHVRSRFQTALRSGEPTTEAGRRLLAQENIGDGTGWVELPYDKIRDAILAIEAEARATPPDTDPSGLDVEGVVAELVGTEASLDEAAKRLRRATDTLAAVARQAIQESRAGGAALRASDTPGLDVERLATALGRVLMTFPPAYTTREQLRDRRDHVLTAEAIAAEYAALSKVEP